MVTAAAAITATRTMSVSMASTRFDAASFGRWPGNRTHHSPTTSANAIPLPGEVGHFTGQRALQEKAGHPIL